MREKEREDKNPMFKLARTAKGGPTNSPRDGRPDAGEAGPGRDTQADGGRVGYPDPPG